MIQVWPPFSESNLHGFANRIFVGMLQVHRENTVWDRKIR